MTALPEDVEAGDANHVSHHNTIHGQHNLLGFLSGQALHPGGDGGTVTSDYTAQPSGDLDVRVLVVNQIEGTSARVEFQAYAYSNSSSNGWWFNVNSGTNGTATTLYLGVDDTEVSKVAATSAAIAYADRTPIWVRAVLDINNGAGGWTVTFYTSSDGSNWTQLGSTVTDTPALTWPTATEPLSLLFDHDGHIQKVEVRFGGTLVADPYFDASPWVVGDNAGDAHDDSQGNTWTLADDLTIVGLPETGDLLQYNAAGHFEGAGLSATGLVAKANWMTATTLTYTPTASLNTSAMGADAKAVGDFLGTLYQSLAEAGLVTY